MTTLSTNSVHGAKIVIVIDRLDFATLRRLPEPTHCFPLNRGRGNRVNMWISLF
jgi:hypothetical protein